MTINSPPARRNNSLCQGFGLYTAITLARIKTQSYLMARIARTTIGRIDKIDFPDLGLTDLDVKVDTGAYGAAIHCDHIEEVNHNGLPAIRFQLLDPMHPQYNHKEFTIAQYKVKRVKSSNGQIQHRYVFETRILMFNKLYTIELSLTNRMEMRYPVLLGRHLLSRRFVVDPARTHLSYKKKMANRDHEALD